MGTALRRGVAAAALAACAATAAYGSPVVAPPFGDGAVLQRDSTVTVRGDAAPGWPVVVVAGWGSAGVARADADGHFATTLRTRGPGGPYRVLAWSEGATVVRDVWVGEVWLCAGQSNMDRTVAESASGAETETPPDPRLHLFTVAKAWADTPRRTCDGHWTRADPDAIAAFSAVCFFFGRELSAALDVPTGLVAAAFPGTEIELWASERGLEAVPELARRLASVGERLAAHETAFSAWLHDFEQADAGLRGGWARGGDVNGWGAPDALAPPAADGTPMLAAGAVWLRSDVAVPDELASSDARVEMHVPLEGDRAWVNGVPVAADHDAAGARVYAVRAGGLRAPTTTIVVRRVALAAAPLPSLDRVRLRAGDRELAPAEWRGRIGLDLRRFRGAPRPLVQHHALLFDGMIAPLASYPMRGIVWYQGEANVARAAQYRETFPALVRDWRARWGRALPFFFVQLPPYGGYAPLGAMAELREAQRTALVLPATGMVVTTDLADPSDIHSIDKREVGGRLARWPLARTYGRADVVPSGPLFRAAHVDGDRVRVEFDWADGGLVATRDPVSGFTLAGSDRVFHPATATIDGETVVLASAEVPAPVAARFDWEDVPVAALANRAGLPASPFRTDDWPGATDGVSWDPDPAARLPVAKPKP